MRERPFLLVAVTTALMLMGAVAVYVYDRSRDDRVAAGIEVAGIEVGGLDADEARARLEREVAAPLRQPVVVRHGRMSLRLSAAAARVRTNVDGMVERALAESREGNVVSRTVRDLAGSEVDAELAARVRYSRRALGRFVRRVRERVDVPARDADVAASAGGLRKVPGRRGRSVQGERLERLLADALTAPRSSRQVEVPVRATRPKVTVAELVDRYPYFITVDRSAFRLHFYKRLRRVKSYVIAVGQVGFETPEGLYHIQNKAVNPAWSVPNEAWAGELAGQVIPSGSPDNPIKSRWMGIYDGAGIHGTDDTASLGSAASHGCIRMSIPEVEELYDQVPVETPVYIG
jgi:lipoprotein-anchoring transpeptidase ErfK/SrfK